MGSQDPWPGAVAFVDSRVGTFVAGGANQVGRLGFDEFLQHHPDRLADQIHGVASAQYLQQFGSADSDKAIGGTPSVSTWRYTRRSRRWLPHRQAAPVTSKPTTRRDAY